MATGHRTRGIYNGNTIEVSAIEVVSKVLPILINRKAIKIIERNIGTAAVPAILVSVHSLNSLSNALIRIESLCVYLSRGILNKALIGSLTSLLTLNVVLSESVAVNHTSARRNLIEFNLIPAARRHQPFKNADTLTKGRKCLTILARSKIKLFTGEVSELAALSAGSILRLKPLSKQRRSLALKVEHELTLHKVESLILGRSSYEDIEVIPTTIEGNVLKVADNRIGIVLRKPVKDNAEVTTLTLATAHVAQIEEALKRTERILFISLLKEQYAICIGAGTVRATKRKHIEQAAHSRLVSQSAILGNSIVARVIHCVHKSISHFYSPLFF